MSFRPRYHEVLKIPNTEFATWKEIVPPARVSYAIDRFTFFNPIVADQNLSVRKVIAEKKETYIEDAPAFFFLPDVYVAGKLRDALDIKEAFAESDWTFGSTATSLSPITLEGTTLATGTQKIPIDVEGLFKGIPDYKLPSPICVNPNEKLQVMVKGTSPPSANTYLVLEGMKYLDQILAMRLLPYLGKISKALVSGAKTKIVEITPEQFPLHVQTFAVQGMDFAEGDLEIRKGLYEVLDALKIGTAIHECPLTSLDRMYQLNETFLKGEKFILEALATSTATLITYLFAHWIP